MCHGYIQSDNSFVFSLMDGENLPNIYRGEIRCKWSQLIDGNQRYDFELRFGCERKQFRWIGQLGLTPKCRGRVELEKGLGVLHPSPSVNKSNPSNLDFEGLEFLFLVAARL